jgi:hypothetical protein
MITLFSHVLMFSSLFGSIATEPTNFLVDFWGVSCQEFFGYQPIDPREELTAIKLGCNFENGDSGHIFVIDGSSPTSSDTYWQSMIGFEHNSMWLFDYNSNGKVELIIVFHQLDNNVFAADLYVDQDDDESVSYEIIDGRLIITESDYWTVRILANGSWNDGDKVNFNLNILVDGSVEGMFGASTYQHLLQNDGKVDFVIDVVDANNNGRPDYEIRQHQIAERFDLVGEGFHLMINHKGDEHIPLPHSDSQLFWPFLGTAPDISGSLVPKSFGFRPPILINWEQSRIVAIGELVASRSSESNCFIYGTGRLEPETIVDPGFENPFCFYDLTNEDNGTPELIIRMEYWPAHDPRFASGLAHMPIQWIRYSWDHNNDGGMDYGIGLAGRHPLETIIEVGDYKILSISYEAFPYWIMERSWDMAVFVDTEAEFYLSNEGIYEAQVPMSVISEYMTGLSSTLPSIATNSLIARNGLRIEYTPNFDTYVLLYFSPIDNRLHLREAAEGYWDINEEQSLQYFNRNADPYIDEWRYLYQGETQQQLNITEDYLIYTDYHNQVIIIKEERLSPFLFEIMPPRNNDEWSVLKQLVDSSKLDFSPENLRGVIDRFDTAHIEIHNANFHGYRTTDKGFRFVLELLPDFQMVSNPNYLFPVLSDPGAYVVDYDGDRFVIQPWSPSSLHFTHPQFNVTDKAISAFNWYIVESELTNEGLEDVHDLLVCATFIGPTKQQEVLTQTISFLPGEGVQQLAWVWIPEESGTWTVGLETDCGSISGYGDLGQVSDSILIEVDPSATLDIGWFASLNSTVSGETWFILLGATLLIAGTGILWIKGFGRR